MKRLAIPGLLFGSLLVVGAAQAEPMDLSTDLMDGVTAAGHADVKVDLDVWKNKHVDSRVYIEKKKKIYQDVDLDGFFADAEAGSQCLGFACEALTMTVTDVDAFNFEATSYSESEAAAEGFDFAPKY
jgi:hypothetical protein